MRKFQIFALASGLALGLTLGAQAQTETTSQYGKPSIATVIVAYASEDQMDQPTSQQAEGAVAGSCGIDQAIAKWRSSNQSFADAEKVLTALKENSPNAFYYCSPDERQAAYDWTDGRLMDLMNWVPPDYTRIEEMRQLQTLLWGVLHSAD